MTKISAMVVADSKNPQGDRITTMMITFPRFILAELNTHRILSKNSASSRAIPFKTMLKSVQENPFIPIAWQKDHKGMQGTEYLDDEVLVSRGLNVRCTDAEAARMAWLLARDSAVRMANALSNLEVTKQLCNRLLEPFMWHTVIITGTEWENFFALRCPQYKSYDNLYKSRKDVLKGSDISDFEDYSEFTELDWLARNEGMAEIHMMALAEAMWDALQDSTPKQLQPKDWHIPFLDKILAEEGVTAMAGVKIATAMCARVSYTVVGDEKEFGFDKQIALHDRMAIQVPFHASPFEHCARAMSKEEYITNVKGNCPTLWSGNAPKEPYSQYSGWCRNFKGFIQYRELLETKTT